MGLSAHWDLSGDPCPAASIQWAIHRFDGTIVMPMAVIPLGEHHHGDTGLLVSSWYMSTMFRFSGTLSVSGDEYNVVSLSLFYLSASLAGQSSLFVLSVRPV